MNRTTDATSPGNDPIAQGLEGLRLLVVGGGSGIGAATVALGRARGATVVAADLHPGDGVDVVADLTTAQGRTTMVETVEQRLGGLDGLAIVAGGGDYRRIADTDAEIWRRTLALNVEGPALLVRQALPMLQRSDAASVVTVASAAGLRSYPEFSAYGSAKAALVRWTRGAAWELAGDGIRVNCVSPGPIDTPMLRATQPEGYTPDQWVVEVAKHTALRRAGSAVEAAEPVAFLLSRRASYLTGVVLPADGGEVA